jgi:hypothetical protein
MKGNTMQSITKCLFALAILPLALAGAAGKSDTARAGNGGAFFGGMIASHVIGGFVRRDRARTAAELDRTYAQPASVVQHQAASPPGPAPATEKSVEQRLQELDDLAQKGYVTKDEYKTRRKAILDGV